MYKPYKWGQFSETFVYSNSRFIYSRYKLPIPIIQTLIRGPITSTTAWAISFQWELRMSRPCSIWIPFSPNRFTILQGSSPLNPPPQAVATTLISGPSVCLIESLISSIKPASMLSAFPPTQIELSSHPWKAIAYSNLDSIIVLSLGNDLSLISVAVICQRLCASTLTVEWVSKTLTHPCSYVLWWQIHPDVFCLLICPRFDVATVWCNHN